VLAALPGAVHALLEDEAYGRASRAIAAAIAALPPARHAVGVLTGLAQRLAA